MDPTELLPLAAVIGVAATIQGATGFGLAVVVTPLLALLMPVSEAVPLAVAASLIVSLPQATAGWRDIDRPVAIRLALASLAGMPIGLLIYTVGPDWALQIGVGTSVLVAGAIALSLAPKRRQKPAEGVAGDLAAGVLSGVLKTSVSVNGPPLALRLQARAMEPQTFRATMAAVLAVGNIAAAAGFAAAGALTWATAATVAALTPVILAGQLSGRQLFKHLDAIRFQQAVTGLVLLSGALCAAGGARALMN